MKMNWPIIVRIKSMAALGVWMCFVFDLTNSVAQQSDLLPDLSSRRQNSSPQAAPGTQLNESQQATQGNLQDGIVVSPQHRQLSMIQEQMDRVAIGLDRATTGEEIQALQASILAELDQLLEAESMAQAATAARSETSSDTENGNETVTQTPDSRDQDEENLDGSPTDPNQPISVRALDATAWGHLPDRIRERMSAAMSEQFLPEYEILIEAFYKRLANLDLDRQ